MQLEKQHAVDARQVVVTDVGHEDGVHAIQMPHQLPEARLPVRAAINEHVEAVDGKESRVAATAGEYPYPSLFCVQRQTLPTGGDSLLITPKSTAHPALRCKATAHAKDGGMEDGGWRIEDGGWMVEDKG
ncbi:hypothetical protein EYF80_021593 [Liparis tanakae]|uniref:Uncharacterized protein n=1 Tax=Liparis tanakae TaxID=230148 RepID=A0A4Z2HR50_9TELE|nr:hypothetical protein EYF80_021593 [Liparis tanakae]